MRLRNNKTFGLDVGSSAVKVIQLQKEGQGYSLCGAGLAQIVPGADGDSDVPESKIQAIRAGVKSAGIRSLHAVCSVSGPEVTVRGFKFPSLPAEEVEQAVMLEATQVCPFDMSRAVVDYQVADPTSWQESEPSAFGVEVAEQTCGVIAASTREVVRNKRQLAKAAGFNCVLMETDSLALLNCVKHFEKSQDGNSIVILNIGDSQTNLVIDGMDGLPFVRDLPYAGSHIIGRLAAERNVSREFVAESLHEERNNPDATGDICENLEAACRQLIANISETIRYYAAQAEGLQVEAIYVCGGFSQTRGFADLLARELREKVVLWDPLERISCPENVPGSHLVKECGPAFAVATGLAMRSI